MSECKCSTRANELFELFEEEFNLTSPRAAIRARLENLASLEPRARQFAVLSATIDVGNAGSPVLPVQQYLLDTVNIANRIVSFVLDGEIHIGTGILVGPSSVLTAAHLFFENDGRLIDSGRAARMTVEAHTTLVGKVIAEGDRSKSRLYDRNGDGWLIEPSLEGGHATRDVELLDFAIVRLEKPLGDDYAGDKPRGWIDIPTADSAEVLSSETAIRVFQYLDREELLFSAGTVGSVIEKGFRVLHTASTAQSASGALIVNSRSRFVAMHLSGSATGERPKFNRGLPVRRIAEQIDRPRRDSPTVRSLLK